MIKISSGEYCDYCYIEIEKIPDISILLEQNNTNVSVELYIEKIKSGFATVLTEIYQITKDQFDSQSLLQNNSFELLWISEKIENQTYKARIRLFLLIRSIAYSQDELSARLVYLKKIFLSSLLSMKYSVKEYEGSFPYINTISKLNKTAVVKSDMVGNLQSYMMNQCYVYDKMPTTLQDFGTIVDFLSSNPNSAVSIQLIPTYFSYMEKNFIETTSSNIL